MAKSITTDKDQADRFKEAARELETDDNEDRFNERLRRLARQKSKDGESEQRAPDDVDRDRDDKGNG